MASKSRERRAIQLVPCPDCGAPRGRPCYRKPGEKVKGRLWICAGRREAWQKARTVSPEL